MGMVFKKKVKRRRYKRSVKRIYKRSGVPSWATLGLGIIAMRRVVPSIPVLNTLGGLSVPLALFATGKLTKQRGYTSTAKALAIANLGESLLGGGISIPMLSTPTGGGW